MKKWNEEVLDKELEKLVEELPVSDEWEKRIEQRIKKKVQRIVFRTVAILTGVVLGLFLIINPIMNACYLNPYKLNQEPDRQLLWTFQSYFETTRPYANPVQVEVKKKGFAKYEVEVQIVTGWTPVRVFTPNVWFDAVRGNYENYKDPEAVAVIVANRFQQDWNKKEELLNQLKELPESAMIYLSIGEQKPKEVETLRKESVKLEWAEIYQPNVQFQGGLSMEDMMVTDEEKARSEMTESELKEAYLANLKDMLEHLEIWKPFGLVCSEFGFSEESEEAVLTECYKDAQKLTTLESKNYCISGKRDEIVSYLEKTEVVSLMVDEVKLSELK